MDVLPLFTSAYSFKSILTLDKAKLDKDDKPISEDDSGTNSIVRMCAENKIESPILIEENMAAFAQAKKAFGDTKYGYGLRLTFCQDIEDKTKDSENTECKYIIFGDDRSLIKAFTVAGTDGFYDGKPRLDFKSLKELWNESMSIAVPFYDNFIYTNSFTFGGCIPDFSFCDPVFFLESNGLFFDDHLLKKTKAFADKNGHKTAWVKSIFYKNRSDYSAWLAYRCVQNRSSLESPNLQHCMSKEFCLEAYMEAAKK